MVVIIPSNIDFKNDIKNMLKNQLLFSAQQMYYINPNYSDALYFIYLVANDKRKENAIMVKNNIHQSTEFVNPYEVNNLPRFWFNIEILIDLEQVLGQMHVFTCYIPLNKQICIDLPIDTTGLPITPRKGGNWIFADSITFFGNNPILMSDINNYMSDFGIEYIPSQNGGKRIKYGKKKVKKANKAKKVKKVKKVKTIRKTKRIRKNKK